MQPNIYEQKNNSQERHKFQNNAGWKSLSKTSPLVRNAVRLYGADTTRSMIRCSKSCRCTRSMMIRCSNNCRCPWRTMIRCSNSCRCPWRTMIRCSKSSRCSWLMMHQELQMQGLWAFAQGAPCSGTKGPVIYFVLCLSHFVIGYWGTILQWPTIKLVHI